MKRMTLSTVVWVGTVLVAVTSSRAGDWPMFGGTPSRNMASAERSQPPTDWDVRTGRNVKWSAPLGSQSYGPPVVAGGVVYVGTNNEGKRDPAHDKDGGVLMAFDERTGEFLWQRYAPKLPAGRVNDWPFQGQCSAVYAEPGRLWYATNRCETVCLDVTDRRNPRVVWSVDMIGQLGVFPHNMTRCHIAAYKDFVYVITGNGVDDTHKHIPAPKAPAIVCFDKHTGRVVWSDNAPGDGILHGQWASPAIAEVNGRAQVIAPLGDGWVYAYDALTGELIWKFDSNPKESIYPTSRNELLATPVIVDNKMYIANGQDPEHGEGPGHLWCVNVTKQGDVSAELPGDEAAEAAQKQGELLVPAGAAVPRKGTPNPNSAVVWHYTTHGLPDRRGRIRRGQRMNRTISTVSVYNGLVFTADFSGYVHCLDANTGEHYWVHDVDAGVWEGTLAVGGKVFVGDEDGDVAVVEATRQLKLVGDDDAEARRNLGQSTHCAPVYANGVLYLTTRNTLYAIAHRGPIAAAPDAAPPAASAPVVAAAPPGAPHDPWAGEWTQWRGPGRTNISIDTGLMREWPDGGPPLLWRAEGVGEGVPSVAVAGGRVYTLGYRDGGEFLAAWDAAGGVKLWASRTSPAVEEMQGMRWLSQRTPTVDGDRVYTVSARGVLSCVSTADGAIRWQKDYTADLGGKSGFWGYCDYPLVDGEQLVCTPGGKDGAVVALDKHTGALLWKCAVPDVTSSTYAAPVVAEFGGVRQYVQQFHRTVAGVGADGTLRWTYDGVQGRHGNVHTAIPREDEVFCSGGFGGGGTLLKLNQTGEKFAVEPRCPPANGPAFESWLGNSSWIGDHLYTNSGFCIEAATGRVAWRAAGVRSRTTMVVADERLYYRRGEGEVVLAEVNPAQFIVRGAFEPPRPATAEPSWTSPVVAGGRLYLRDQDVLLCYDLRRDRTRPFEPRHPTDPNAVASAGHPAPAAPQDEGGEANEADRRRGRDAIFVPTPQDVVERMLELAKVTKDDVVYDLGCGDGRIVVTAAAKFGCRAVGYDTDPECVRLSERNVFERKVGALVTIERKDVFEVDLSGASVVTLYMGRDVNRRLVPQLRKLKPGSRVVSHAFEIEGHPPDEVVEMVSCDDDAKHVIYVWTMPFRAR